MVWTTSSTQNVNSVRPPRPYGDARLERDTHRIGALRRTALLTNLVVKSAGDTLAEIIAVEPVVGRCDQELAVAVDIDIG